MLTNLKHIYTQQQNAVTNRECSNIIFLVGVNMLTNLKHIYTHQEDYVRALSICDRILLLAPGTLAERRDRGIVHFHLKHYARAVKDLAAYVEHAPAGEDTSDIQRQIKAIRQMIAMLN